MEYGIILYLLFLSGSFLLWFFVPTYSIFILFMILLVLLLLDIVLFFISFSKASLTFEFKNQLATHNSVVVIQVKRHVVFPYAIGMIKCYYALHLVNEDRKIDVIRNYTWKQDIVFVAKHCGVCQFQVESVRFYDLLHIFHIDKKMDVSKQIIVLPALQDIPLSIIEEQISTVKSDEETWIRPGDDLSEIYELRKYREGDLLKQIHWKASLKTKDILVKVGSEIGQISITLGFIISPNIDRNDKTLEMLHSLCLQLLKEQKKFVIATYDTIYNTIAFHHIDNEEQYLQVLYEILYILDTPYALQDIKEASIQQSIYVIDNDQVHVLNGGLQ